MAINEVLPADSYIVVNKSIITEKDKKIVSMLYQPIIGHIAVSLYYTLLSDLSGDEFMSDVKTHHYLMAHMQLKLDDIIIAREKLEAIGLLKTYLKKDTINQYIYLLYSPLEANEFFNHPILNIVLYNNLGKREYENLVSNFKMPPIRLSGYDDITKSFNDVFRSVKGTVIEKDDNYFKRESNNIIASADIDFDLLKDSLATDKGFTNELKDLITCLAYIYKLNTIDMKQIIRTSLNEKGSIDKTLLRKNCRDYYKFENSGNLPTLIYNKQPDFLKKPEGDNSKWAKVVYTFENITPYQLLKAKYGGAEPTDRDKQLIENLMIDQKLNPGVVNVLISYVLKTNNEQLKKNYIETIAGQWKRSNIETVEEAMRIAEKEHKKMKKNYSSKEEKTIKKSASKEDNVPAWFNNTQDIDKTSKEDVEELDRILNELV